MEITHFVRPASILALRVKALPTHVLLAPPTHLSISKAAFA